MSGIAGRDQIRIVVGGLLAEVVVIAVFIAVAFTVGRPAAMYSVPVVSFITCFGFAVWVARRARSRPFLQGLLVGVVATLVYLALTWGRSEPWIYVLAHVLKVLGGAGGGMAAAWSHGRRASFP